MKEGTELTTVNNLNKLFPKCKFSNQSLIIDPSMKYEEWVGLGEFLKTVEDVSGLWRGDWLNFGENTYEEWTQQFDPSHETTKHALRDVKYITKAVPPSRRRDKLNPSVYGEIASLKEDEQEKIMDLAEEKGLTIKVIRETVKEYKKQQKIDEFKKLSSGFNNYDIQIFNEPFQEYAEKIADNSIDLILTDPPYPVEFLPLWEDMFTIADRILKPSHFLVTYANHQNLDEIFRLKNNLKYYWTFKLDFTLKPMAMGRNLIATWKPVLIYQKLPFKKIEATMEDNVKDYTPFNNDERDMHADNWGQSIGKVEYLIDKFSKPNGLIFEPFAGTGTTLIAAQRMKRKCIGTEIDKQYIDLIKGRVNAESQL